MSEITRPVGDIFKYNNRLYRVEKEISACRDCAFIGNKCSQIRFVRGFCASERTSKDRVIFKEIKEMKKSDLKAGNIVECANGDLYLIAHSERDGLYGLNNDGWLDLSYFEEDFTCKIDMNFNINKVYSGQQPVGLKFINNYKGACLWNREAKVELTLEDIAKKFNISVDKLRIKD